MFYSIHSKDLASVNFFKADEKYLYVRYRTDILIE
jgi:hypothetical protein